MESHEKLQRLIAEFFEMPPERITRDFTFTGPRMQGSIARYALDASIRRRLGVICPAAYTAQSYGELEAAVVGTPATAGTRSRSLHPADTSPIISSCGSELADLRCGVDVEMIDTLPVTDDYWTHDFYEGCFTPNEIAYCLMQDLPRVHFAGRWCAKEAAKKCEPGLLSAAMKDLEVVRETSGAIFLQHHNDGGVRRLPLAVSISHTPLVAVAMAVRASATASVSPPQIALSSHGMQQMPVEADLNKQVGNTVKVASRWLPTVVLTLLTVILAIVSVGVSLAMLGRL